MRTCSQTRGVSGRGSGALAGSGKLRKWRAAGIGRSRTMRQSHRQRPMHMLAASAEGSHEDYRPGCGHAPVLDRGDEYGLIKRQSRLCLGHEYVLEGVWDGEENLYLGNRPETRI